MTHKPGILTRVKNLLTSKRSSATVGLRNWERFVEFFHFGDFSTEHVSEKRAMRITTVWTCQLILAETLSSLTWGAYRTTKTGRELIEGHPVNLIFKSGPNTWMTFADFLKALIWSASGWGGGYAEIIRNEYNEAVGLNFWDCPGEVLVGKDSAGVPLYSYKGKTYRAEDLIIIKRFSLDGYTPLSPIRWNSESLGFAIKTNKFRNLTFGTKPPGYLSSDAVITKEQMPGIVEHASSFKRATLETGEIPVLMNGLKYNPVSFSPADLQLLEQNKSTKEDIYAMFRIPPVFAQNYDRATFDNAGNQDLLLGKYTLLPWITTIEQEFNKKLFKADENAYVKGNMNVLMRADYKTRTEGYAKLWAIGAISINQIAEMEEMESVPDGDRRFVPMNMMPLDRADDIINKLTAASSQKVTRELRAELEKMGVTINDDFTLDAATIADIIKRNGFQH